MIEPQQEMGACVDPAQGSAMMLSFSILSQYHTQGLYRAHHLAFSRMIDDARRVHADGVIGSDIHMRVQEVATARRRPYSNEAETIEDYIAEFFAFGTIVAAISERHEVPRPRLVVDLEDHPPSIEGN